MKKVLLIFASFYGKSDLPEKKRIFWEPLGISYLASYLREYGYKVDILYPLIEEMDETDILIWLNQKVEEYFMIGLSTSGFSTGDVEKYVNLIRKSGYTGKIFLGGLGPTCNWKEFVKTGVDAVIIGEGEKTLLKLAKMVQEELDYRSVSGLAYIKNGKAYRNGYVELIDNLDHNVFPARDISLSFLYKFNINQIHIQIQTSRGCLGNCSFCSISSFLNEQGGKKYRSRTPKNIVEEIAFLNRVYGFSKFDFMDENFFPLNKDCSVEKALLLLHEMKKQKICVELFVQCHMQAVSLELLKILKSMNVTSIFVGIDSFHTDELFLFNKKYGRDDVLRFLKMVQSSPYSFNIKSRFRIKTGFINFTPISTLDTLYENGILFKEYNLSCKKLIRKLIVNPGQTVLIEKIRGGFEEFSNDSYFQNKNVDVFYNSIMDFYAEYELMRGNMRNIENAFLNDNSVCPAMIIDKIVTLREMADNLFYEFYFCRIEEIRDLRDYGSNEVKNKLRLLEIEVHSIIDNFFSIDNSVNFPINDRGV